MIVAVQGDQARAGNRGRQQPALLERDHVVMAAVRHQRRRANLAKQIDDVDLIAGLSNAHRGFG